MNRRDFSSSLTAQMAAALSAGLALSQARAQTATPSSSCPALPSASRPPHDMSGFPASWTKNEQIAMLIYPEFTALDMVGPQYMFTSLMGAKVHIVAKNREPVMSDTRMAIMPTMTLDECPKDLDILFVPGGTAGTVAAMRDETTLRFVTDRGSRAKLVTSVCTGSLILGAAGLLRGYKATSHWATRDLLSRAGATPVDARVVRDRNRITGAGVTAGIDFGLSIVEQLRDREYAQVVQLIAEYAPEPHLNAGSTHTAPPKVYADMKNMFAGFAQQAGQTVESLACSTLQTPSKT